MTLSYIERVIRDAEADPFGVWWIDSALWSSSGESHSSTESEAIANVLAQARKVERERKRATVQRIAPALQMRDEDTHDEDMPNRHLLALAHTLNTVGQVCHSGTLFIYDGEEVVRMEKWAYLSTGLTTRVFPVAKPSQRIGVYHAVPSYDHWRQFERKAPNGCGRRYPRGRLWKDGMQVLEAA